MMMHGLLRKYMKLPPMAKASFWFLICSILQKGISVITTPIFTRLMSTSEFGDFNTFNAWRDIINVFITLNLSWGVYNQGLVKFEEDRKRYSSSMQGLTLILILFWTIIYLVFQDFFNPIFSLSTGHVLMMILLIWITAVYNFWASEQKVDYKYKKLIIITLVASILTPIVSIIFMHFISDKVFARIFGMVLVSLMSYAWMFFVQVHSFRMMFSKKYWKHALAFNIPLIPHYLSQVVLASADRIMIERMIGSSEAGIYSLAYSLSLVMTIFNNALMQTISPWIYKKIKYRKILDIKRIAYPTLIGVAAVNVLLIAFAPEVIRIFAPIDYRAAIWVIPPVAMSVFFMYSYDLFAKFGFYLEKTKLISVATIIGASLNIILNYVFIEMFGYMAAGYTTLLCYIFYAVFHYIFMRHICKSEYQNVQPYSTKMLLRIASVFMACGFAFLISYNFPIIRYAMIIIIAILIMIERKKSNKRLC